MDRNTELALLEELLGLKQQNSTHLDETEARLPISCDVCEDRFGQEMAHVFRAHPQVAADASELPGPGDYVLREIAGLPVIRCRDREGQAHVYLNVWRHRGARLLDQARGCRHSFTCPYHGWTWSNTGELRSVPHQAQGFPDLDKADYGLRRLPCTEVHGWLLVLPDPDGPPDFALPGEIAADLDWIGTASHRIAAETTINVPANW